MQKVIRRSVLAKNQAKRKAQRVVAKDREIARRSLFKEQVLYNRLLLDDAKDERKNRREDWLRGPLAPRRDVAQRNGVYGTVTTQRLRLPKIPEEKRSRFINIVPGDRVCVMVGREKGKIGKVTETDPEAESVTIEGINLHDVEFPKFATAGEADKRPYRTFPLPYRMSDVRLVVPLTDEETGAVEDVVVDHVHGGRPFVEVPYGSSMPRHTRYITGMNMEIPWPEPQMSEFKDEDIDTLRIEVEAKTFVPFLQSYPMPATVIDELRNKYSSLRTRHDPEYIEKKQREDAYQAWLKSRKLLTPKTESLAKEIEQKLKIRQETIEKNGDLRMSKDTADYVQQFLSSRLKGSATSSTAAPSA